MSRLQRRVILAVLFAQLVTILLACSAQRSLAPPPRLDGISQPLSPIPQPRQDTVEDVLAEIAAMATPKGVAEDTFSGLKSALSDSLRAREVYRVTSRPPTGESNRITDAAIVDNGYGTFTISWHYRNIGDYDQNSVVGIADITPLAVLFQQEVPPGDDNSVAAVVDGNGDSIIDIKDVTPLAANFGVSVGGYQVQGAPGLAGPYSPVQDVPFEAASGLGRKEFSAQLMDVSFRYYRVVPYDSQGKLGDPSDHALLPANVPDIVSVSPTSGVEGASVQFSAEITGATAESYAWDFGEGAVPNTSSEESPIVTLAAAGEYQASLTASNVFGSDTFHFTLTVYPLSSRGDWWTLRHDAQLTGHTDTVGPSPAKLAWQKQIGYAVNSAVVDSQGRIAIPSAGWYFYLLDASGNELWQFSVGADLRGSPVITENGAFLIASADGNLYCLEPSDGSVRWQHSTGSSYWFTTPAIAPDGTIATFSRLMSTYGAFYILSPEGNEVFSVPVDYSVTENIAVGNDGYFYWGTSKKLYGYDTDGTLMHDLDLDPDAFAEAVAVAPTGNLVVKEYNRITGYTTESELLWRIDAPANYDFIRAPAVGPNEEIYILRKGTSTYLDYYNSQHELEWQYESPTDSQTPPIVDGEGKVYFGTQDGHVICLDANGQLKWQWVSPTGEENLAGFTLTDDGLLLVPSADHNLYAFEQSEFVPGERGPWWTLGGNAQRNGRSEFVGPRTDRIEWTFDSGTTAAFNSPIIDASGTVYVTDVNTVFWAINPDGTERWSFSLTDRGGYAATQGPDGTIFVTSRPNLFGLSASGEVVFSKYNNNGWRGVPMVDDTGNIYAASDSGWLYAFAWDGTDLWNVGLRVGANLSPALGQDGTVYYADDYSYLWALNPLTGEQIWRYDSPAGSFSYGVAVGNGGNVYAVTGNNLLRVNKDTGNLDWFFNAPDNLNKLPAFAEDGTAYIGCSDGSLYAIDASGNEAWHFAAAAGVQGQSIVDAEGVIYFGAGENLYAVDATGQEVWHYQMPEWEWIGSAPAIGEDGTLYVGAGNGKLYAFKDAG